MGSSGPSEPNKLQTQLQKAVCQEGKATREQPEDIKGRLLDISANRKRGA
ncbi:MAG: hypothetical protein R3B95_02825 [Nitrospirales bacterium]|nr:hypothetical protein [Nitrospira sp.]MDR4482180.1 hypothetical protein [Nitrospirales bacterium]